jgi:hypothetical protein
MSEISSGSVVISKRSLLARLREETCGLYLLLSLSLLLKIFLLCKSQIITNDGPRYINQAIQMLNGQFWPSVKADIIFLYSFLIAGVGLIIPDLVLAGQLISLFASVLTVIPLYLLIRDIENSRVAFWGCSFFVILPSFNEYAVEVMRDSLFLFVFVSMILLAWRFLNGGGWKYMAGAMLLAIAGPFLRIESLIFIPFFFLFSLIKVFLNRNWRWQCLLMLIGFVGILLFASFYLKTVEIAGRHISLNNFFNYSEDIKKVLKTVESALPGQGNENTLITTVTDNVRLIYFIGIVLMLLKQITFIGIIFLIPGVYSNSIKLSSGKIYVIGVALTYMVMAFDFNLRNGMMNERYLFVPVLMTLPWIGIGVERFSAMASRRYSHVVVFACLTIFLLVPLGMTIKKSYSPQPLSAKMAGEWIRKRTDLRGISLIANERKVPFYANRGAEFIYLEFSPFQKIVQISSEPGEKLISISLRKFNLGEFPGFDGYDLAAKFEDQKYASLIYHKKN